ncbi:MAG: serine/threonine protein kinase, partial [Myxococcales bacterium]|nr:serine/threonine protein kinase [Myxococcales bacterium]
MERGVTSFEKRYGALRQYRGTPRSRLLIATHPDSRKRRLLRIFEPQVFERVSSRAFASAAIDDLQRIDHPRLVRVLERGTTRKGKEFIVIEHIRGKTLAKLLEENGALDLDEVVTLVLPLLEALSVAHEAGLVHSNIHPGNINIGVTSGMQRQITLLDIGFYVRFGAFGSLDGGEFVPQHCAPEQIQQQQIGVASDIYALGLCLFEMLTGNHPFWGATPEEVLFSQLYEPAPRIAEFNSELSFPREIEELVERCLSIEPANRWASVDELHRALIDVTRVVAPSAAPRQQPSPPAERLEDLPSSEVPPAIPPPRTGPPPIPAAAVPMSRPSPPPPVSADDRPAAAAPPEGPASAPSSEAEPNPFKREDSGHGLEPGERVRFRLARGIVAELSDAFAELMPVRDPSEISRRSITQHGYSRAVEERIDELFLRLAQYLLQHQRLELQLESFGVMLSGRPLDQNTKLSGNLWYLLFHDGVRELRVERGVTIDELRRFVRILKRRISDDLALMDDVLTLHWEADTPHIVLRATDEFFVLPTPSRSRIIASMFPR